MTSTSATDERLFIATDQAIHCVDAATGRAHWTHRYAVEIVPGFTDICRWDDIVVVVAGAHVIAVRAADGAGVFSVALPPPFDRNVPMRVLVRGQRLIVHDSVAIAGLSRTGVVEWLHQLAPTYLKCLPSVLWGDVARGGLERTFDRR